jgi:hypothetical protein
MTKPNDKASKMSPPTARKQASYDEDVVTGLKPDDVLLGRGIGPNEHQGNVKFREIVSSLRSEYLATNKRKAKDKIAHKAIQIIKTRKGRFLRKMNEPASKHVGAKDVYVIADEKTAVEKTKQALRFLGRGKKHSDSNDYDQDQDDRGVASPSAAAASVGAQAPSSSGLPTHLFGAGGAFDQLVTFPTYLGGGALPLNYSREVQHQQTSLLLANELNRDSVSRSHQPSSLLLDSTLRYLSGEQHQAPSTSHQHARLFSESQAGALGPMLLKAQRMQQMQAMLLAPAGPSLMDGISYNLPLLQQHNQSSLSIFPNQLESLQSSMLPSSTALNRLLEDSLIAAALGGSPSYLRESQPQDTRDSSSSAYPSTTNPGQPRLS